MNLEGEHPQPREEVAYGVCRHGDDCQVLEEGDFLK